MLKRCKHCRFFDSLEDESAPGEEDEWGTCNRYPPVLFNRTPKDALDVSDEIAMMWKQPAVTGTDWCGEFSPSTPVQGEP